MIKIAFLVLILIVAIITFWPRNPLSWSALSESLPFMSYREISFAWTIIASKKLNIDIRSKWDKQEKEFTIIIPRLEIDKLEKFDKMLQDLKKNLPGIKIIVEVI